MFSVLYKGYTVDYNGSATFNVYKDGRALDQFTVYDIADEREAFQHILEYIDEITDTDWNHGELL